MSDDELADSLSNLSLVEQVKAKHKKELKELEAKSTKLRHSVPKGDKKRLKEVKDEIAKMEADLKKKHDAELKAAEANTKTEEPKPVSESEAAPVVEAEETAETKEQHQSRAQRRREKKAAVSAVKAELAAGADDSAESLREIERTKIASKLEAIGFAIHDISPNGDCLFGAVAHQLDIMHGIESSVPALRLQAADEMRRNIDDYQPFMEQETDTNGFLAYCQTMETTHEWGGQMELRALSRVLHLPIRVVQAEGPDVVQTPPGREPDDQPLIITFHRHEFGLGEHYNSAEPWESVK